MDKVSFSSAKYISLLIPFILLAGCMNEIDLGTPDISPKIVVTSFFTDSLPWEVNVYKTFSINKNKPTEPILDANVSIVRENKTIHLQHTGEGVYTLTSYPEVGVDYTLLVEIEGQERITATSSVPPQSTIKGFNTDLTLQTVVSVHNIYTEMISTRFKLMPPSGTNSLCRVRVLKFDSIKGYKRYYFSERSFDKMLENGVDQQLVSKLKVLTEQIVFGPLWDILAPIIGEVKASDNSGKIETATFLDQVDYRDPDAFSMELCVAPAGLFYQAPYETFTLLGSFSEEIPATIFTNHQFAEGEFWLEFLDLSDEYYKFQKDYSLQLSNRGDISNSPVLVYSNINNAVGIFAGYKKQMFRLSAKQ